MGGGIKKNKFQIKTEFDFSFLKMEIPSTKWIFEENVSLPLLSHFIQCELKQINKSFTDYNCWSKFHYPLETIGDDK